MPEKPEEVNYFEALLGDNPPEGIDFMLLYGNPIGGPIDETNLPADGNDIEEES